MAGMGPPPKNAAQRRRQNPTVAMTRLPAEGRQGEPPTWPLIPDVVLRARRDMLATKIERLNDDRQDLLDDGSSTAGVERKLDAALERYGIVEAQLAAQADLEATLWRELWALPQAVEWSRLGWLRDVAQYARFKVMAELGELDAAKEARMWSDRLGLTPLAMLRLRWEVTHDEVTERRAEKPAAAPAAASARARLRVVDGLGS